MPQASRPPAAPAAPQGLKAVLFDLDGVIFDSRQANIAFYNHMLQVVGLPPRAEEAVEVIHRESMEGSLRHLMGEGEKYRQAMEYWRTMDPTRFVGELRLFPGVKETLERLGRRYTLAVITNRSKTTRASLDHFGLWDSFQLVVTPLDTGASKPDPSLMHHALKELRLEPGQVVYVGDSELDQRLCQSTGVRLIAFRNPALDAWAHVESFAELARLLGVA